MKILTKKSSNYILFTLKSMVKHTPTSISVDDVVLLHSKQIFLKTTQQVRNMLQAASWAATHTLRTEFLRIWDFTSKNTQSNSVDVLQKVNKMRKMKESTPTCTAIFQHHIKTLLAVPY